MDSDSEYEDGKGVKHGRHINHYHVHGNVLGSSIGPHGIIHNHGSIDKSWKDVYDWLTDNRPDLNYLALHAGLKRRCLPGVGQWFLNAENLHSWKTGHYQTLFCHGARKEPT